MMFATLSNRYVQDTEQHLLDGHVSWERFHDKPLVLESSALTHTHKQRCCVIVCCTVQPFSLLSYDCRPTVLL